VGVGRSIFQFNYFNPMKIEGHIYKLFKLTEDEIRIFEGINEH